jgi:DNA-directed RNA polymerase subunit RPC12/RpoP
MSDDQTDSLDHVGSVAVVKVCAHCKEPFEVSNTDEEAEAEAKRIFGSEVMDHATEVVCDDCRQKIKPTSNPVILFEWLSAKRTEAYSAEQKEPDQG